MNKELLQLSHDDISPVFLSFSGHFSLQFLLLEGDRGWGDKKALEDVDLIISTCVKSQSGFLNPALEMQRDVCFGGLIDSAFS